MNDENIQTELKKFNETDASLQEVKEKYGSLTIDGIKDKFGYAQVKEARKVIKAKRLWVESTRKELKASVLERGRLIDAEAKRIKGHLEPIEKHLVEQQKAIDDEKDRIKQEEEKRKQKIIQDRVLALSEVGAVPNIFHIQGMTDEQFQEMLKKETERYNAELEEKRKAEAARREKEAEEEKARLEAEKLRLEKEAEEKRLFEEEKEKMRIAQEEIDAKNAELKEREDEVERSRLFIEKKLVEDRLQQLKYEESKNLVDDINKQDGEKFVPMYERSPAEKKLIAMKKAELKPLPIVDEKKLVVLGEDPEVAITLTAKKSDFEFLVSYFDFLEGYIPDSDPNDNDVGKNAVVTFAKQIKEQFAKQIKEQLDG
jgi:hypothetical protein